MGAYLGLAIGDALGATVEFMTPREIAHHYGQHKEIIGGGWLKLQAGQVTDDTTMSLALGEAILGQGMNAVAMAQGLDGWMRGKPVDIGNTVRRGLLRFRISGEPHGLVDEHDAGNGACMRSLPIALATLGWPLEQVNAAMLAQNHITHNNPLSDAATLCVIRMVQLSLQGSSLAELLHGPVHQLLDKYPEFTFRQRKPIENPSAYIVHTLRCVLEVFFDTDSFEACLIETVNRGGDADTTGAIAGMIAGAWYGLDAIPMRWHRRLDSQIEQQCREQALALLVFSRQAQR
jgi:ADP-ribosyl-[dinitrogen reductase] hydrolase